VILVADLGDLIPLAVEIRDSSGALADPTGMVLTISLPDGTVSTPSTSHPSVGRFEYNYVPTIPGRFVARWVASGLNSSAYVETFDVRASDPGYLLSPNDAKRALNMDLTDTSNDEELRSMLEAVTRMVEDYRGEAIARRTEVEYMSVGSRWRVPNLEPQSRMNAAYKLLLATRPVLAVTSIVRPLDGVTWLPADVTVVSPATGSVISNKDPFYGDLVATYTVGYQVVPASFVEAAKIILRHLWEPQQTPGLGPNPFNSGGDFAAPGGAAYALPNRAAELLGGRGITIA
jgi:hypothetical protein